MKQAIILFPLLFLITVVQAKEQAVKVTGILVCNNTRLGKGQGSVQLWESDWPDPDDPMTTIKRNFTDKNGTFWISGSTNEWTGIEPYIIIEHTCSVPEGCRRETIYNVPEKYINSESWYNMTYITLEIITDKDTAFCPS